MASQAWWADTGRPSEFLSPSAIVGGRGQSVAAPALLKRQFGLAAGTAFVAVDDIVLAGGLAEPMLAALRAGGWTPVVRGGFGSEPVDTVIDAAAAEARTSGADVVIGLGGGSVLDSAKIIALLLRNEGDSADWLGPVDPPAGLAPLLLIPTTCGTGSEATRIAMLTVGGAKRASSCARYVPTAVILDPDLIATLPGPVVASTAMDALAHSIESLMSTTASPMSSHHALRAAELVVANVQAGAAGDPVALEKLLWASHLAGQALNAGVVVGHSLAYCLAFEHPMPHGTSCALALPYCIAYNHDLEPAQATAIARVLTGGRSYDLRIAADDVLALATKLGLPTTTAQAGLPEGLERAMAERCVAEYPRPTNPVPIEADRLEKLLVAMRTGDLDTAFAL